MTTKRCARSLSKLRDRIVKGEDFAGLASTKSADPGSAPDGGDLGWSGPGTFVPEFDKAIADLKVNEISEPFKTRYGWHIVQMLGTRTYDSTDDVRRQRAFAAIRESKADEETELWLRRYATRPSSKSRCRRAQRCTYRGSSITSGEPAGIGPDACVALAQASWDADIVVAADADCWRPRPTP